jgi:cytochrome b561
MMAAKGRAFDVFGLFTVPPLMATDRAFGESLEEVHEMLSYLMLFLVGLHAAAAVFHQAILKDGVLARMLPFGRTCESSPLRGRTSAGFPT